MWFLLGSVTGCDDGLVIENETGSENGSGNQQHSEEKQQLKQKEEIATIITLFLIGDTEKILEQSLYHLVY